MASTDTNSHVLTVTKLEVPETNMGGENLANFLTDALDKVEWQPLPDEKKWTNPDRPKAMRAGPHSIHLYLDDPAKCEMILGRILSLQAGQRSRCMKWHADG